jgi:hypothetical protein
MFDIVAISSQGLVCCVDVEQNFMPEEHIAEEYIAKIAYGYP